jgi:hypothetical protein
VRPKIHFAPTPASSAVASVPRVDLRPARGEPALEEDQHQRDRAERPRQLVVLEVDAADAFGAGQHPEREEQQQRRDPHAVGEQRADDPGGQQDAGDEDQDRVVVAHPGTLERRAARGARRSRR